MSQAMTASGASGSGDAAVLRLARAACERPGPGHRREDARAAAPGRRCRARWVYAASHLGAALPSLVAGQLVRSVSLLKVTAGYAALVLLALAIVLACAREPRPRLA